MSRRTSATLRGSLETLRSSSATLRRFSATLRRSAETGANFATTRGKDGGEESPPGLSQAAEQLRSVSQGLQSEK